MTSDAAAQEYPGRDLGLPATGRGSIGRPGRRFAALAIDLASAVLIGVAFFDYNPIATNVTFALLQILFIPTIGGSPGHRIMRMYVAPLRGGWVGLWRPIVRTALLFLIIPAVVWDSDQRGLHDKIAGTVLLRSS
ncbi:RDD family protein [Microbacterium album]|uniref:RDD family protein n=1 Tax=Microbacterium album TaxID=2053191 RepID=A0A917ML04_9MICO|nr:RDD family protein [Microbacterium album]GGH35263.1 RDD family protein [Microbacterium album]